MDRGYACRGKVGAGRDCDEVGSGATGVVVFKRRLENCLRQGEDGGFSKGQMGQRTLSGWRLC